MILSGIDWRYLQRHRKLLYLFFCPAMRLKRLPDRALSQQVSKRNEGKNMVLRKRLSPNMATAMPKI
jgi:hypothetical protein